MRLTGKNLNTAYIVSKQSSNKEGKTILVEKTVVGAIDPGFTKDIPDPGDSCGLVSIEAFNLGNGLSRYVWTYRSSPDQSNATEKPQTIRELAGSMKSIPITQHDKFARIYGKYGKTMRGGRVEWLDGNPDSSSSSGLSTQGNSTVNPMAGINIFQAGGSVFSETKFYSSRRAVPTNVLAKVGKIDNPEGVDGDSEEWIRMGVTITSIGAGYQVDTKWLREPRKWLKELYG